MTEASQRRLVFQLIRIIRQLVAIIERMARLQGLS